MTEKELLAKIEEYEKKMGIGKCDPAKEAYFRYVEMLRQQTDYLKDFKISAKIGDAVKDSPVYARAIEMIDGLPKMIKAVKELREEFGFSVKIQEEAFSDGIAEKRN